MKTKIYLLFIGFLFSFTGLSAQNIEAYLETQQSVPFQKLYLHTDREFYFTGDTLWFAAYLLEGQTHIPTLEPCNLYVDLIKADGKIIKNELFLIQNGFGSGYVPFSDSVILEGSFILRAYTDYLKNFGDDAFFTKSIRVSTVKNSFELQSNNRFSSSQSVDFTNSETLTNKLDVSFLPEGGFLLADESNCVAFKAVDQTGKGKDISGKLLDENGNVVLTFKSVYKGAGKFYFYPKFGKLYTAKIDGFPDLVFQLPEVKESGGKILLVNQEKNKLQVVVQTKEDSRILPCQLTGYHKNEVLFSYEIDRKSASQIVKINSGLLKDGINRLVLYDKKSNPISERLVFKQPEEINQIEIELNEKSFSTREEIELALIPNKKYSDELAKVSLAVIDENYISAHGISQNIASYLLLDSELKGNIDSPTDYFVSDEKLDSQKKLDLLMTTNGWSNYIWNWLKEDSIKIEFKPQLGFTFKGNVKRGIGNKALTDGNVSLLVKSDSTTQFLDLPLDEKGIFEFRNIVFYDSASVFAQARNKKDKHNLQFEFNLPEFTLPKISSFDTLQLKNYTNIPVSVYRQRYLNEMRLKEFFSDKENILLEEVNVTAKKPKPKFKIGTLKKNDGPFKLTWEMTAGSSDIVEYLAYKVPGIFSWKNGDNELMIKLGAGFDLGPPGFFIDDFNYFSIDEIKGWNVSDFSSIEIITPPMSGIYGARAISGAVVLTLKRGDEIDPTLPLFGGAVEKVKGFTPLREFYSPKYIP